MVVIWIWLKITFYYSTKCKTVKKLWIFSWKNVKQSAPTFKNLGGMAFMKINNAIKNMSFKNKSSL